MLYDRSVDETSYQPKLRNISEEQRPQIYHCGSLKSRFCEFYATTPPGFQVPAIKNDNMADARNCESGETLTLVSFGVLSQHMGQHSLEKCAGLSKVVFWYCVKQQLGGRENTSSAFHFMVTVDELFGRGTHSSRKARLSQL
jgi:hypothetical protein